MTFVLEPDLGGAGGHAELTCEAETEFGGGEESLFEYLVQNQKLLRCCSPSFWFGGPAGWGLFRLTTGRVGFGSS